MKNIPIKNLTQNFYSKQVKENSDESNSKKQNQNLIREKVVVDDKDLFKSGEDSS